MRTVIMQLVAIVRYPRTYRRGKREACDTFGMTYGTPYSLRSAAYDLGRNEGERKIG